jgi:hypothetical protein
MSANVAAFTCKAGSGIGLNAAFVGGTAVQGQPIDTRGYEYATAFFTFGDVTGVASSTMTITVEESASGTGSWAAISGATSGAIDTTSSTLYDRAVFVIGINLQNSSRLRYLRLVATPVANVNLGTCGGCIVLSDGMAAVPTSTSTAPTAPAGAYYNRVLVA